VINERKPLTVTIECTLTDAQVRALPHTEQADIAYGLFREMADKLAEFGFNQGIVANVVTDLGADLCRLDGMPRTVVLVDHRRLPKAQS